MGLKLGKKTPSTLKIKSSKSLRSVGVGRGNSSRSGKGSLEGEGDVEGEDGEDEYMYDAEERRLMPLYLRREAEKGNAQKALRLLGLV